jgi:serine/threonine-protein phosphatase 2A regulatory subunit A
MEIVECDSILYLIDELKAEDHNTRLHAINSLDIIAEAIGEQKTRDELIPYINELLEDENEEVLLAIASKLGELAKYVGESSNLGCLIPGLSTLCNNEETVVQEKAVNSLGLIAAQLPGKSIEEHFIPALESLASSTWQSARISSCSLFQVVLPYVDPLKHETLVDVFLKLGADEMHRVRKAAATNIGFIWTTCPTEKVYKLFQNFIQDDNESVRQMVLQNLRKIIADQDQITLVVKNYTKDKSWRVRYSLVEKLDEIILPMDSIIELKDDIVCLINDPEPEVRCIAISNLFKILEKLPKSIIEQDIIPCFDKISQDTSKYVRLSLMKSICWISCYVDTKTSIQRLMPIINYLIRDESFEVKMSFAENMNAFNAAIGLEKVLTFSIPLVMQMMNDGQWRLRLKIVESLPQLAELLCLGPFTEQISTPMMKWVEDPVFAVREAALESIKDIGMRFGSNWTKAHIYPLVEMLANSPVFSKRMTSLKAINKLHPLLDSLACYNFLVLLSTDKIPNIRLNVAKTISIITNSFIVDDYLAKIIEKMTNDIDTDVRFYANQTLAQFKRSMSRVH